MSEPALVLIGTIVGAFAGLLPRLLDMISGNSTGKQQEKAQLKMMLAGVLMSCVQSTNEFLENAARLRLDQHTSADENTANEHLRETVKSAFAMKSAWMNALVSFGDPAKRNEPLDERRRTIQRMLRDLDKTYDMYQVDEVSRKRIIEQLQQVERLSRNALNGLVRLPATS